MKEKLRYLRTKNPRDYWKIINNGNVKPKHSVPIDDLFEFFKALNDEVDNTLPDYVAPMDDLDLLSGVNINVDINVCITEEEILKCVKSLKRNKSVGEDAIANEYIISTIDVMMPLYVALFNTIFDTGVIPSCWLVEDIVPIYKNKGDTKDPKNYRPITILSCVGKLFTSILNNRLNDYSDSVQLILENQAGFRKKYSTVDHIFALHSLIELFKNTRKKTSLCLY